MTFYSISALINILTSFILGALLLMKGRSKLNLAFSVFSFSVTFWSAGYYMWQVSNNATAALFWLKFLTIGSILIPVFYLHFTTIFLESAMHKSGKVVLFVSYFLAAFFVSISQTDLMIKGVSQKLIFKYWPNPGVAYGFFLILFISCTAYSIYLYFNHLNRVTGAKREQIKFLLIGTGLAFFGGSTNFLLWYDIPVLPIGNIVVSLYVILTAYAIVVHHLMNIKVIFRKYSVYLFSLAVIVVPAVSMQYFYPRELGRFSNLGHIFLIIVAIITFPFVKDWFYKLANKYFFSSLYDSREVISRISEQLRSTIEVDRMYQFISQALVNSFHVRAFGVLIYNEEKQEYFVQYNNNSEDSRFLRLLSNKNYQYAGLKIPNLVCDDYLRKNIPIIINDLKRDELDKYKNDVEYWQAIGIEVLVPLIVKDRNIGLIALSPKESGDLYNSEDLYVLKVIGVQVAIALENALLYQDTLNFNIKLKKEVEKQTRELLEANEKLTNLDQAKSEFISIASHQLRTPLSIIKGYVSMILDGNFGPLTSGEKDSLEKVYKSNERLIDLVESLLNISRIESGRLQFIFEKKQLDDLVSSVCDELLMRVNRERVMFEFVKPKAKLPAVNMDESKMRQVIMNLIDNSIKYTAHGNVTVSLKKQKDSILFCVSDSGVGIKPEDMPNLFRKFSRGTGSSLINAEGTGLGLFVAKKMIEAHGGRIWAESRGKHMGSQFYFEMPYVKQSRVNKNNSDIVKENKIGLK